MQLAIRQHWFNDFKSHKTVDVFTHSFHILLCFKIDLRILIFLWKVARNPPNQISKSWILWHIFKAWILSKILQRKLSCHDVLQITPRQPLDPSKRMKKYVLMMILPTPKPHENHFKKCIYEFIHFLLRCCSSSPWRITLHCYILERVMDQHPYKLSSVHIWMM